MPSLKAIADALDAILQREGWPTMTNRAADRGGWTKGGITLATLKAYRKRDDVTTTDLSVLSEAEARVIYRDRYLKPWEFVPDDRLFEVLIDYAVTSGHDDPTRALQEVLGVAVDGVLGPATRSAVLGSNQEALRQYVIGYRIRHMVNLALEDPKLKAIIAGHTDLQILNLRGWLNRATSFLDSRSA